MQQKPDISKKVCRLWGSNRISSCRVKLFLASCISQGSKKASSGDLDTVIGGARGEGGFGRGGHQHGAVLLEGSTQDLRAGVMATADGALNGLLEQLGHLPAPADNSQQQQTEACPSTKTPHGCATPTHSPHHPLCSPCLPTKSLQPRMVHSVPGC